MTTPATTIETVGLFKAFAYGRGYVTTRSVANPAAGSGSTIKIPGDRFYRLLAVNGTLTASATVATRTMKVQVLDGDGNLIVVAAAGATVAASGTAFFQAHFGWGGQSTSGDGTQNVPLWDHFLQPGWQMVLTATSLQAGDTITGVRWLWEEFPLGGYGYPEQLLNTGYPNPQP